MDEKQKSPLILLTSDENSQAQLRGILDQVTIIATGGMSQIFRARQPSLDRYVVVKKLKDELMTHPETLERFRREARALAAVLHQNIAHVYDFVESGRESFLLMEYIEGIDLSHVIQKVGNLPAGFASAVMLGVAKGVSYIHAHRLIHRDIKPGNIRLTTRGGVKLMDFGIVVDTENASLTRPGMMVGSPAYLSPEQVLGDPISHSADIFLLGICFYEMLTGTKPFKDESGQTVFQKIRKAEYIPARVINGSIPKDLDKMISRCLELKPQNRFADVKDLIHELEKFMGARRSSHAEDVILKYLDEEALLSPGVPYTNIEVAENDWKSLFSPRRVTMLVLLAAFFFLAGWLAGQTGSHSQEHPVSGYVAPRPIR